MNCFDRVWDDREAVDTGRKSEHGPQLEYLNDPAAPKPNSLVPAAGVLAVDDERAAAAAAAPRHRPVGHPDGQAGVRRDASPSARCGRPPRRPASRVEVTGPARHLLRPRPRRPLRHRRGDPAGVRDHPARPPRLRRARGERRGVSGAGGSPPANSTGSTSTRPSGGSSATGSAARTRTSTDRVPARPRLSQPGVTFLPPEGAFVRLGVTADRQLEANRACQTDPAEGACFTGPVDGRTGTEGGNLPAWWVTPQVPARPGRRSSPPAVEDSGASCSGCRSRRRSPRSSSPSTPGWDRRPGSEHR